MSITIEQLKELEPRLNELEADIRLQVELAKDDEWFCANRVWYHVPGPRDRLIQLVGWESDRDHPLLRTQMAYDVAYRYFYSLLPDCKHPPTLFCL